MDFDQEIGEIQRKAVQSQEGIGRRKIIMDSLAVASGQSILDLGCGGGYQVRSLALAVGSEGRVVGVDPSLKQIEVAREYCSDLDNVEFTQDTGTDLSFRDEAFDSATSTNVLDYIGDVNGVVAELRRVFRNHCPHQMLPLDLPTILLNNGFAGINSMPIPLLNMTMHNNAFARWTSKLIAAFAIGNGISEDDVALWLRQLEEAERDGHFGFVSMSVLTTGVAI